MNLINEVKKKREFSGLPDSVVLRALELNDEDVKETRSFLRKYFGVFLTNRVMRFARSRVTGHGSRDILVAHKSSALRDYEKFYGEIFEVIGNRQQEIETVIDLGCGVNGFSYEFLPSGIRYVGVEAVGQLVDGMNGYFEERGFDAWAVKLDLFDLDSVLKIIKGVKSTRVVFLFQVVDALEGLERNYSKKFLLEIMKVLGEKDMVVVSYRVEGLSGSGMYAKRKWLVEFLESEFGIDEDFEMDGERIILIRKK
ncbi:MAG: hypothetical protein KJ592_01965 [Nanoarchaeota archaeon]|nr:hypothetical protein [Nanoarchaeota archaeon]